MAIPSLLFVGRPFRKESAQAGHYMRILDVGRLLHKDSLNGETTIKGISIWGGKGSLYREAIL